MSRFGTTRSSQRGIHQARSPSSVISAGISVIRIRNASIRMPIANASPIDLITGSSGRMKPENTETMISAAAVTTRAELAKPSRTASRAEAPCAWASCIRLTRNTW